MKHLLILLITFIVLTASAFPQEANTNQIKGIREYYNKIGAEIAKIEEDPEAAKQSALAVNELVINSLNKSWPAVGVYRVTYRFYYHQIGETHYPEHLTKVTIKTRSAARDSYREFLFNEKNELVFVFHRYPEGNEERAYFDQGKLIQYSEKKIIKETPDLQTVSQYEKDAVHLQELFKLSIQ